MSEPFVGRGIDRVDAGLKVTGKADYAAEVAVANIAHAVIVTSTFARGRVSFETQKASQAPGVLAVLVPANAPKLPGGSEKQSPIDKVLQLLQDDAVSYNDAPVAVVVADTLERAREAGALLVPKETVDAASLAFSIDPELARAYAPKAAGPSGPTDTQRGDFDAAKAAAKFVVEATYTTPPQTHNPMEMHSTIAVWHGEDHVTLYDATQGVFGVRSRIAATFAIPKENVRVISHYVGGGFGSKGSAWSHVVLAAMAARVVRRPVKLVLTRQQMFSLVGHRPRTIQKLTLAADARGKLAAIKHDVWSETSRFDEFVEPSAVQTRMLYACPAVHTSHRLVRIDVPTPTFMRAPGESTGTYALECALDELAHALKLDPIALRLANYAETDQDENKPFSSKSLRLCYAAGAEQFGWRRRSAEPRSQREGRYLVGTGMATATYPAHQRKSAARARMLPDGTAVVQAGSQDIGTGTYTIMSQIAADAIGLPASRVRFELGDTSLPETPVSGGSQTASSTGSAVKVAGMALRAKLVALALADAASPIHGLSADALDVVDGAIMARADPNRKDALGDVVRRTGQLEVVAEAETEEKKDRKQFSTHSFGAQFAEVRVDEDLGEVRVTRFTGAFAAGKILNAKTARSQLLGGIVWGIGFALLEHTDRDPRTGRNLTRDLQDYHVPVNADVPPIEIVTVDEDDPHVNEIGAKGIGEIGITGAAAAIANAVFHATGRRVRDLPITPDKLIA